MNICSYCDGKMMVKQTVDNHIEEERYRLRRCDKCGREIYTVEFEVEANEQFIRTLRDCDNARRYGEE